MRECGSLTFFAKFQRMHRLETLIVEKDKFLAFERRISKIHALLTLTALVPSLSIFLVLFLDSLEYLVKTVMMYLTGLTCFILLNYSIIAYQQTIDMYRFHKLTFWSHICTNFMLHLASVTSLGCQFLLQIYAVLACFCQYEVLVEPENFSIGICAIFGPSHWNFRIIGWGELVPDILILLPILTFFLLYKPHDCYKCLGKDPDRIYSSFQLNLEERAKR